MVFVFGQPLAADCNLLDQPSLGLNLAKMRMKHDKSFSPLTKLLLLVQDGLESCTQIQCMIYVVRRQKAAFEMLVQCSKCRTMLSNQPFWSQLCTATPAFNSVVMYTCQLQWCLTLNCSVSSNLNQTEYARCNQFGFCAWYHQSECDKDHQSGADIT